MQITCKAHGKQTTIFYAYKGKIHKECEICHLINKSKIGEINDKHNVRHRDNGYEPKLSDNVDWGSKV